MSGQEAIDIIETETRNRIETGARVLSLGGDHSVAYPIIKPHAEHYEGLTVFHFDAHPDL